MKGIDELVKRSNLLSSRSNEFAKLSPEDRLVCLNILERNSHELEAYINYTVNEYAKQMKHIDVNKLLFDLFNFAPYSGTEAGST